MKLRTLETPGEQIFVIRGNVTNAYFPEGTKRIVQSYFFLPKELDGETQRGFQIVEQEAKVYDGLYGGVKIKKNKWKDIRFISSNTLDVLMVDTSALVNA